MGTWEVGLYQNDLSADVRDDYVGKLKAGKDDETALQEILKEYQSEIDDIDCKYDFYLALADTLWKKGRMPEEIKIKALQMIEEDKVSERWESEKIRKERIKVLDILKTRLEGKMPERKKVSVHKPYVTGYQEGEVYYFQIKEEVKGYEQYLGWYVLFYVDRLFMKDWYVRGVQDEVADAYFFMIKEKPKSLEDFEKSKPICFYIGQGNGGNRYKTEILESSKRKRPKDLTLLGRCKDKHYSHHTARMNELFFWNSIGIRNILWGYEDQLKLENMQERS